MKIGKSADEQLDEFLDTLDAPVRDAIEVAAQWGDEGAAHHLLWVIDQMVQALLTPEQYRAFVAAYQAPRGEDGDLFMTEWEQGIAP